MRRAAVRRWLPASLALMLLAGCDSLPGRPLPSERPQSPSEVKSFIQLYGEYCAGCHGADGRLGAARPMNDALYLALVSDETLRQVTRAGVPDTLMPAFAESEGGRLTDEQVDVLVRGMRKRWGRSQAIAGVTLPPYSAGDAAKAGVRPGDPVRGAMVYAQHCQRCHGPSGGGGKAGAVTDPAYLALVSDQALRTAVIAGRIDLGMPDWRGGTGGEPMSDQQVSDVVAWLAAHRQSDSGETRPAPAAQASDGTPTRGGKNG